MKTNFQQIAQKYTHLPEIQSIFKIRQPKDISVHFLAQGEYNLNFILESSSLKAVLRLNTGSQMHLKNQISYEYRTLQVLERTGITPKPIFCDDSLSVSPYGMLLMEHIPGRWLEYEQDYLLAADVFARIHQIKYFVDSGLIKATYPATDILNECKNMANVFLTSSIGELKIKKLIVRAIKSIENIVYGFDEPFHADSLVLNNTEVNSSNFLYYEATGEMKLVDWEKAIFSLPTQDLSHFLIPTTTFWKTNYFFSIFNLY